MPNVIGVFEESSQAHRAVEEMMNAGIDRDQISFVSRDSDHDNVRDQTSEHTSGGRIGGGIGAAVERFFRGISDKGVPEEDARHYEDRVREGEILISVHADNDNEADRAYDIMQTHGAIDGEGRATPDRGKAWPNSERRTFGTTEQRDFAEQDTARIPVTEERMTVGKRAVEAGRMRIYGRVTEKPVEESVRLRDERVHVERRAVDRPVTDADRRNADVMIEITETKEEPVVGKQERVVEEIVVGKTADEHTETVRDKVRRQDVEVERTGTDADDRTHRRR